MFGKGGWGRRVGGFRVGGLEGLGGGACTLTSGKTRGKDEEEKK